MEVSIGLYALLFIFFFLILPGFIAKRFYYHGEFSKQIIWTNNILTHLFSSLFVGILLTLFFVFLYNLIRNDQIDIDGLLNKFDSAFVTTSTQNSTNPGEKFSGFISLVYTTYLPFLAATYIFSAVIGYFLSKLVLFLDLDTKWKFFRFSNNWHYIFSGRIIKLRKNKGTTVVNRKVKYTYLDILVAEKDNDTTLYSGLFANYDLSYKETDKLERIHLYRASRFKKTETEILQRPIPGNVFTICADRILNINTTYIYYDDDETLTQKFLSRRLLLVPFQIIIVWAFLFSSISILFSLKVIDSSWYLTLIQKPLLGRMLIAFTFNICAGLLTPFTIDHNSKKVKFNGWNNFFAMLFLAVFFGFITWYFYF
jgi:hypothetical protein